MQRSTQLFNRQQAINDFSAIRIRLASPEKIRSWSYGEVTKPETINYRTFKPEKDGLFCARIFGPVVDWECLCGKYKRMKYRNIICDKCGVEVTLSKVRRDRMGHIELAAPVSHVWFFKGLPSRIGYLLDMSLKDLERVLYFEAYVVIDPGGVAALKEKELLTEERYRQIREEYGPVVNAKMGAEAIKELLKSLNLAELAVELRYDMRHETSAQKRTKIAKRLKVVEGFIKSQNQPEWMILDVIPVIPPELRPLVPLDGGRFATSDLNDLYRRVINRNNRLKKLLELRAPDVIIRNEKRMLQEAVDALFDNGRRGRVLKGGNNRPLKSLSDTLKGKQGRFRQNLLGKRVDYSGRTVIVVGPELKLDQCGLPKDMALELFKPFIYNLLEQYGFASTVKTAKEMVEAKVPIVWDVLEEVIKSHPVLLNRAPTLHRLGIQAFYPILVEGKAIRLHPLVCTAFNADFDGDQMAVHVPLSPTSIIEAETLMLSSRNILSPAHGNPVTVPTQDIVLGAYYLTLARDNQIGEGMTFARVEDVLAAREQGLVNTHTKIRLRYNGQVMDLDHAYDKQAISRNSVITVNNALIETTVGRVIFNNQFRNTEMPYINGLLKKKGLTDLVFFWNTEYGRARTVEMLDILKDLSFTWATKAGISFGIDDMVIPPKKEHLLETARQRVIEVESQYQEGLLTNAERYNKVVQLWSDVTEEIAHEMFTYMDATTKENNLVNSIFIMADSGARGSKQQIRQLAGMRGLMAKPSGEIIESPITANFKEGLTVLQYFISTHGARKGLADTALKTADSGYLTRRLVDVAQDVIITEFDCGTLDGITAHAIIEQGEVIEPLSDRIIGRVALNDIYDPHNDNLILSANELITGTIAQQIQDSGIQEVAIRSVLTCESARGVCQLCYGKNLATGNLVEIGEATGVIAAQSIGEPGTQLTMRTFHIGGTASAVDEQSTHVTRRGGVVSFQNMKTVINKDGDEICLSRNGSIVVTDSEGREEHYTAVVGARLKCHEGQKVDPNFVLVEWDPYSFVIITEVAGRIELKDIILGVTMIEEVDEATALSRMKIIPCGDEKVTPSVIIKDENGKIAAKYPLPNDALIVVETDAMVTAGETLAKIPKDTTRQMDITGGLPRIVELFEGRRPKEPAIIAEIDGVVSYGNIVRGMQKIHVENEFGVKREYSIPKGKFIHFKEGENIRAGEQLIDGARSPHDILAVLGEKELQKFLLDEIQEVYRLQGVNINDKHIEIIIRQMMRWMEVDDVGDTELILGERVDKFYFQRVNEKVIANGGSPAKGHPLLVGITKASLSTDSFISAASFQETTRVLTEAAIEGKVDTLRGLKENVIMGKLIPAGTGMALYRDVEIEEDETLAQANEDQDDEYSLDNIIKVSQQRIVDRDDDGDDDADLD
ncbi:MAG: DNA-directed RNA polymerase subunit beta' [Acidobacteria bacterium]|nr:DNA-directed RNA polymerase subunit beta' [Acidobacteriota bacterium]MCB9396901.1 DNA-directed RNA polymerase subunit beta' [Acidobacteriota bacterium]